LKNQNSFCLKLRFILIRNEIFIIKLFQFYSNNKKILNYFYFYFHLRIYILIKISSFIILFNICIQFLKRYFITSFIFSILFILFLYSIISQMNILFIQILYSIFIRRSSYISILIPISYSKELELKIFIRIIFVLDYIIGLFIKKIVLKKNKF
jgi:hypothetical protein